MSHAAQAYARTSQTTAPPREIEAQALLKAARQLQDVQTNWTGPDKNMHNALLFNRRLWSIFMSAVEDQRQSAAAGDSPEHRQYRRVRDEADHRHADESGSGEAEIADRHQLQSRGGPVGQGLMAFRPTERDHDRYREHPVVQLTRRSERRPPFRAKTKYVAVDPKLYQGTWPATYADKKTFKIHGLERQRLPRAGEVRERRHGQVPGAS